MGECYFQNHGLFGHARKLAKFGGNYNYVVSKELEGLMESI
jgi:hypothetical protein